MGVTATPSWLVPSVAEVGDGVNVTVEPGAVTVTLDVTVECSVTVFSVGVGFGVGVGAAVAVTVAMGPETVVVSI